MVPGVLNDILSWCQGSGSNAGNNSGDAVGGNPLRFSNLAAEILSRHWPAGSVHRQPSQQQDPQQVGIMRCKTSYQYPQYGMVPLLSE